MRVRHVMLTISMLLSSFMLSHRAAAQGGTWAVKAPLPVPSGVGGFAMASIGGKVYVAGGQLGSSTVASLEVYDPATDTWTIKAPMPTARLGAGAAVVNGLLYVIGGCTTFDCSGFVGTMEAYDPVTDAWTTKASMPTARRSFGVGVINGVVYAVGGLQGPGSGGISTNEAYDPATNSWSAKAPKPTPLGEVESEAVNGLLYALGGWNRNTSSVVEAYSPSSDTWVSKTSLPSPRSNGGTGVINGKIYFAGGAGADGELVVYDSITDTWTTDVPLPSPCPPLCSGAVTNGTLYITGQTSVSQFLAFTPTLSPQQLLSTLADTISNLNILSGIANSLDAKLQAVESSLASAKQNDTNTACNQLGAFINAVSAQSGKQLTASQANQLIGQANLIRTVLGCP